MSDITVEKQTARGIQSVRTMNKLVRWGLALGGLSAMILLSGAFTTWLGIEALALLVDITA